MTKDEKTLLDRQNRMAHARKIRKQLRENGITPPHKPRGKNITTKRFIKSLKHTNGIYRRIAERLGVHEIIVAAYLKRKGPEHPSFIAWEKECERIADLAEGELPKLIKQNEHLPTKAKMVAWELERKRKGYETKKEIKLEGGDNPIQVNQTTRMVDLSKLPLDVRRTLLESLESEEQDATIPPLKRKRLVIRRKKTQ